MNQVLRKIAAGVLGAGMALTARAQFTQSGTEPAKLRWETFSSENFQLIFPAGLDSLARVYAASLETFRVPNSMSSGFLANQFYSKPMPVVLHSCTAYSNGSVSWAPRNLSIYTNPESYNPEPLNWVDMLSVHEGRHVAQMQLGNSAPKFQILSGFTGEMSAGAMAALYSGPAFLEGDAVTAETALTASGRGRTADFLSYYRVAFAEGQWRDYWQWSLGSQRLYTPDYYRAGYMLHSGMRYTFGKADFTKYYYQRILRKPLYPFFNLQKSVKEVSGMRFRKAFRQIEESFAADWEKNDSLRRELAGEFMDGCRITDSTKYFRSFYGLTVLGDNLYAIRTGLDLLPEIVRIDSTGKAVPLAHMGSQYSRLTASPVTGKLYWTEYEADIRWEKKSSSRLWSLDPASGKKKVLSGRNSRYYNPSASPEYAEIAVVENLPDGRTAVLILDALDGGILLRRTAPDHLQAVEAAWVDGELFASAIGPDGFGIYRTDAWKEVLRPESVKISHLFGRDGRLWFSSDRDGSTELYSLGTDGSLRQETNLRFGGNNFTFAGDSLLYTSITVGDNGVRSLPAESLLGLSVSPSPLPRPIPERLSEQEDSLLASAGLALGEITPENVQKTPLKPYRKVGHLFKFHSWAPIYIDEDVVSSMSFESVAQQSSLGATAWFQNDLESSYGQVGVELLGPDYPALHMQWVYRGGLPVIELRASIGGRNAFLQKYDVEEGDGHITFTPKNDTLSFTKFSGSARMYVPLRFNSGGWQRGIIPSVAMGVSNDFTPVMDYEVWDNGKKWLIQEQNPGLAFSAALRGYSMLPAVPSGIFPRFGAGFEVGVVDRPWHRVWIPTKASALLYGYLPGFVRTDGWRWEGSASHEFGGRWTQTDAISASVEYALPFAPVDWSFLSPITYIRNFELHLYGSGSYTETASLTGGSTVTDLDATVGAGLAVYLGNIAWLPYGCRVGAKYIYNPLHPELSGFHAIFEVDN